MSRSIRALAVACIAVAGAAAVPFTFVSPAVAQEHAQHAMTDGNIVALVMAINDSEIGAATAALTDKNVTGDAKDFAEDMNKEHTANNAATKKVADKAGIKPEQNDEIKAMAQKNADALKQIKMLEGPAFEKAYIDLNVTAHTEALAALDKAIAAAQNADLKEHLTKTREHVQHHFEEAKEIQTKQMNADKK